MKLFPVIQRKLKHHHYFRHIRFFILNLFDEELTYFASSLSFYTISTIIPIFFIMFSLIPKLKQFDEHYVTLKKFLIEHLLPVQTDVITSYIDSFIANATQLSLLSLSFTVIVSMLFFINFSYVINSIFKAKDPGIIKTVLTYFLLIIFLPLGLALSFYLTSNVYQFFDHYVYDTGLEISKLTPFILEWGLFFLIYKFAPNVFVHYKAAAISAFIAMIIWGAAKALFVHYVFLAKTTSTIYGPFAITIFFLTWIYLSWVIFVYGLRLCYLINRSYGYSKSHHRKKPKNPSMIKGA